MPNAKSRIYFPSKGSSGSLDLMDESGILKWLLTGLVGLRLVRPSTEGILIALFHDLAVIPKPDSGFITFPAIVSNIAIGNAVARSIDCRSSS